MFTNEALRKLILPIALEQVLIPGVGMITVIMISYAGEEAMSGIALVDMINFLVIFVLSAIATGGAVVVSQYIGNKEKDSSCMAANQLVLVTVIISAIVMVLVMLFNSSLLRLLFGRVEKQVMEAAITFFVISGFSYPFLGMYTSTAALFRSMEKAHITTIVAIAMNAISVFSSAIAIYVLNAGVAGVAVAILLSRIFAAVTMLILALNKNNPVHLNIKDLLNFDWEMIQRILRIAIPNGVENGLFHLGRLLLSSIIALFGTSQIAANGVATSFAIFAISFASAINLAIVTVVGQCVGANDFDQATFYIKKLIKVAYIGTIPLNILMILVLPWLLGFYTLSYETHNLTYILIVIHNTMAIFIWPISFTLPSALRAAGDARFPMMTSILSMLIFRITFGYILGVILGMGVVGVWLAMCIDWFVRSLVFTNRFYSNKWTSFRVI